MGVKLDLMFQFSGPEMNTASRHKAFWSLVTI